MAAPQISHYSPEGETHTRAEAAGTVTLDLPSPGAGQRHKIESIWLYALGTITAFYIEVQLAAGTAFAKVGGQVNAAALPFHLPIGGPVICASENATKIVVVVTGATSVQVTVNLKKIPG